MSCYGYIMNHERNMWIRKHTLPIESNMISVYIEKCILAHCTHKLWISFHVWNLKKTPFRKFWLSLAVMWNVCTFRLLSLFRTNNHILSCQEKNIQISNVNTCSCCCAIAFFPSKLQFFILCSYFCSDGTVFFLFTFSISFVWDGSQSYKNVHIYFRCTNRACVLYGCMFGRLVGQMNVRTICSHVWYVHWCYCILCVQGWPHIECDCVDFIESSIISDFDININVFNFF